MIALFFLNMQNYSHVWGRTYTVCESVHDEGLFKSFSSSSSPPFYLLGLFVVFISTFHNDVDDDEVGQGGGRVFIKAPCHSSSSVVVVYG